MRLFFKTLVAICLLTGCANIAFSASSKSKYDPMKRFTKAYDIVKSGYVRDVTNEELMDGAIKGMLQELDPHSTFLNVDDFKEIQEATSGEFFGIGIEISTENNQLIVVSPIEDTPADKAGLRAGDLILAVDGQPTQDLSTQEAVSKIRGPKGSAVELLILHKDEKMPVTVSIVRDAIPLVSVKTRFITEDGYLWVRLTRFNERTTVELLDSLREQAARSEIKGIVLDLRNNPGGLFQQSVSVSDVFLKTGSIVSMRGRGGEILEAHQAKDAASDITCPIAVLVNQGSASASEIVAGALQDHSRAVIVGEKTFGKGSVQKIEPLGDGTAVKMTIARYYTPKGRSIQAEGIQPDLEIAYEAPREDDKKRPRFNAPREKDLSRHLENNTAGKDEKDEKDKNDKDTVTIPAKEAGAENNTASSTDKDKEKPKLVDEDTKTLLEKDNQLRMALQIVKSLPKLSEIHAQ